MSKLYYWFWHDVCRQKQPFTYSIRDSYHARPILWLAGFSIIGLVLGHLFW